MVVVGRFGAPYGVKGWLNVISYTDPLENLVGYRPWFVDRRGNWTELAIAQTRPHRNGFVVQIVGVEERNAAQAFTGQAIGVPDGALPEVGEDEFYWKDLIGLDVVDQSGAVLGQVSDLMATGANDVIVVRTGAGEILIPFVRQVVTDVDLQAKRILVDWQTKE
jgi:16S rRNA processing protein RimM